MLSLYGKSRAAPHDNDDNNNDNNDAADNNTNSNSNKSARGGELTDPERKQARREQVDCCGAMACPPRGLECLHVSVSPNRRSSRGLITKRNWSNKKYNKLE